MLAKLGIQLLEKALCLGPGGFETFAVSFAVVTEELLVAFNRLLLFHTMSVHIGLDEAE